MQIVALRRSSWRGEGGHLGDMSLTAPTPNLRCRADDMRRGSGALMINDEVTS
jgi:hypothetical protein